MYHCDAGASVVRHTPCGVSFRRGISAAADMKRKSSRKPKAARAKRPVRLSRKKSTVAKPPKADNIAALVAANAQALGLNIEPEWREGVIFNLGLIMRIAALVDEFALPDDAETAPIYRA